MTRRLLTLAILSIFSFAELGLADFKYTESAKVTGGMMAGMMKLAGAFSKQPREPMVSTTSVKGNRLRRESGDGHVQIIDLDGRRIIEIDTQKQTYSVVTFDDMRAAIRDAQEKARRQSHQKGSQNSNVKMTPKLQITPTDNTKDILGQTTHEVKVRLDMQVESTDPNQAQPQAGGFWFTSDSWVAPNVKGSEEITKIYEQMAKELEWVPGSAMGMGANPDMEKAMAEYRKQASSMKGFPLLSNSSFGTGGAGAGQTAGGQQQSAAAGQQPAGNQQPSTASSSQPATPSASAAKALGGMFGGFGRKKKNQTADDTSASQPSGSNAAPASSSGSANSGSMMDTTVEVTSFSNDPLDASLFDIPAGYKQIQADASKIAAGSR